MKTRPQFSQCYEQGERFYSRSFLLFVFTHEDSVCSWLLGLSVSRKVGNAVRRNRMKRLLREFFRQHRREIPAYADIVVVPKRGIPVDSLTLAQVCQELEPLMRTLLLGRSARQ